MTEPTPNASELPDGTASEPFRLDGIPDTRDPIANLLALLAGVVPNRRNLSPAWIAHPEGMDDRLPESSDAMVMEPGAPSDASSNPEHLPTLGFRDEGDAILLLGEIVDLADPLQGLGGSAFLEHVHGLRKGSPPPVDPASAGLLLSALVGLIHTGVVKSAHACEAGGLAVALARCCRGARHTPQGTIALIGAFLDLTGAGHATPISSTPPGGGHGTVLDTTVLPGSPDTGQTTGVQPTLGPRLDALLFGEIPSRVVITCAPLDATCLLERARLLGVPAIRLGTVGGQELKLKTGAGEFASPVTELHALTD